MESREYAKFGPWVYEIEEAEDIPKLFAPYIHKIEDAIMLIKIPREIERRNANPNMDLYDFVIGVYGEYLLILKRNNDQVETFELNFRDIVALKNSIYFLAGTVTFYLAQDTISFHYNTVSEPILQKLIDLVRDRYTQNSGLMDLETLNNEPVKGIDDLYVNLLYRYENAEEPFKVLAIQPSVKSIPIDHNFGEKVIHKVNLFRESLLCNTMFLTSEKELLVVTRGKTFKRPSIALYSKDFTYIPHNRVTRLRYEHDGEFHNLTPLYIDIQGHEFKYYMESNNGQSARLMNHWS